MTDSTFLQSGITINNKLYEISKERFSQTIRMDLIQAIECTDIETRVYITGRNEPISFGSAATNWLGQRIPNGTRSYCDSIVSEWKAVLLSQPPPQKSKSN